VKQIPMIQNQKVGRSIRICHHSIVAFAIYAVKQASHYFIRCKFSYILISVKNIPYAWSLL